MSRASRSQNQTRADWLVPAGLLALGIVPAIAGALRLAELGSGAAITPENARFYAAPAPVVIHIVSAVLFSMLGAFQFSAGCGMAAAMVLALTAIARRNIPAHQRWMTLAYALGMGAGWAINMVAAEWLIMQARRSCISGEAGLSAFAQDGHRHHSKHRQVMSNA